MSPNEVLSKHTSRELTEWAVFLGLEPRGEKRADLHAGIVASTIANAVRGKGQRAFKPDDFMPKFGREQEMTDDELENKLGRFAKAYGGKTGKLSEL
jgi:hypothetical protein